MHGHDLEPKRLLLVGATGMVGTHVLALVLADPRVSSVIAPTRRELPPHPKLVSPKVDYDRLDPQAAWWSVDAVICTLGTTMRAAGSRAAFRRVDLEYPLAVAEFARAQGASTFVLNSATGADERSWFFYNRVKGEVESALVGLAFDSLSLVRPGVIGGHRKENRRTERLLVSALGVAGPWLPRHWRLNPAPKIAEVLVESALTPQKGVHVTTAEQMV